MIRAMTHFGGPAAPSPWALGSLTSHVLPDELKIAGLATFKFHRQRVWNAGQKWKRLRDHYYQRAATSAALNNVVDANVATAIGATCEQYRRDCITVLDYLYRVGQTLFGDVSLGVLPVAAPIVAGGFAIASIVALVGWLKWLDHQDNVLTATMEADTARMQQANHMLQEAKDLNAPSGVRAVAAQNSAALTGATVKGTPDLGGKKGFFDGLIPQSALGKAALAYGVWRFGPDLLRKVG
jgi:hypothetical protein